MFDDAMHHTLSRLWKTRLFLKATMDQASGPAL
jgi:hypothetical protein